MQAIHLSNHANSAKNCPHVTTHNCSLSSTVELPLLPARATAAFSQLDLSHLDCSKTTDGLYGWLIWALAFGRSSMDSHVSSQRKKIYCFSWSCIIVPPLALPLAQDFLIFPAANPIETIGISSYPTNALETP